MMINKAITRIGWMRRARRFGVTFVRHSWFKLPQRIVVNHREVQLAHLNGVGEEKSALVFFENFIEDQYGLHKIKENVATIADLGANVGCFTLAARSYFPHAVIHAYEPNPRILSVLRKNACQVGASVFSEAVGRGEGYVSMIDKSDSGNARTTEVQAAPDAIPQVPLQKVIERLGGSVDLLKIDCEGAEWQLLSLEDCLRNVKQVRMEYHLWGERSFVQLVHLLRRHRFGITHHQSQRDFGVIWASPLSV